MAGQISSPSGGVMPDMNVLPLIDILLVLVIVFFVLNLGFQYIPAQIPEAERQQEPGGGNQIVLELRDDGSYAVNAQIIPSDQLLSHLTTIFEFRPTKVLFLRASDNRTYGEMVEAMDLGREAGAQVLGWMPGNSPLP
jgi:biopolymer transport protein TolR